MILRHRLPAATGLLTLILLGSGLAAPLPDWWGINHLHFLPTWSAYLFGLFAAAVLLTLFVPKSTSLEKLFNFIDTLLFGSGRLRTLLVAAIITGLFYVFRVNVHLLGDGYTWLAVFSRGDAFIHKWTEPGSIWLLRQVQRLLGGHTDRTATLAFQILSIGSGAVYVYAMTTLAALVSTKPTVRVLFWCTALFSGSTLLFLGYVEFYPLVWAAVAVFFACSLKALKHATSLWPAVIAYLVAVLMHLQALYFLPAVLYLVYSRVQVARWRSLWRVAMVIGLGIGIGLFAWLYHTRLDFELLILPFFSARPDAPGYTVFSWLHLRDLLNESLLVLPSGLVLLTLLQKSTKKRPWPTTGQFLLVATLGGLAFLAVFGAAITMARDWDIMALSYVAPLLLLGVLLDRTDSGPSPAPALVGILLAALGSLSFLAVQINDSAAEARFATLLNNRNRTGWVVYAGYFGQKGDTRRQREILAEIDQRFPTYTLLKTGYALLEQGKIESAARIADQLSIANPYDPNFMQFRANVLVAQRQPDSAAYWYQQAMKLKPYHAPLLNELSQLYLTQGKYDLALALLSDAHRLEPDKTFVTETMALTHIYLKEYPAALAWADSLCAMDPRAPGAYLIRLTVAMNTGDYTTARENYRAFLEYGQSRSDYEDIREYYRNLVP